MELSAAKLSGRRIVIGVGGGIAAYKAVEVTRRLVDLGAHVVPVMTSGARRFVGETTFSALASEPVRTSLFEDPTDPIPHTRIGQGAELVIVAPATARLISAYATGYSHDLLTNVLIATRAPVLVCPAMHTEMWEHPAVQDNMTTLRSRGVHVVEPGEGRLAGGDVGAGRLAEPADIVAAAVEILSKGVSPRRAGGEAATSQPDLQGLRILVTAGGTREPIDPVRFVGNRSSGKQGHLIAEQAANRGASVILVTTSSIESSSAIERVDIETANQMHSAVMARAAHADIVVMSAAVADFTPVRVADHKIKKADGVPVIELCPTPDILAELGTNKTSLQTLVGFAAETHNGETNAERKLRDKNADLLVLNDVSAPGVGFEHDTNEVTILSASGSTMQVPLTDKRKVADAVLTAAAQVHRSKVG